MRLLDWIIGREPVATATGIAAVVTAGLGVAAAFGADITAEQIAAVGAFVAAVAGWLARKAVSPVRHTMERRAEAGSVPLAMILLIVGAFFVLVFFFGACDALFDDQSESNDLGSPSQILRRAGQPVGYLFDGSERKVALGAEQPTNLAGPMAMVDSEDPQLAALVQSRLGASAYGAEPILQLDKSQVVVDRDAVAGGNVTQPSVLRVAFPPATVGLASRLGVLLSPRPLVGVVFLGIRSSPLPLPLADGFTVALPPRSLISPLLFGVSPRHSRVLPGEPETTMNHIELVSHEYDCDPDWDDCGGGEYYGGGSGYRRGGNDNRGGRNVSPGPFDRSPVEMRDVCISLDCSGRERREDPQPEEMR